MCVMTQHSCSPFLGAQPDVSRLFFYCYFSGFCISREDYGCTPTASRGNTCEVSFLLRQGEGLGKQRAIIGRRRLCAEKYGTKLTEAGPTAFPYAVNVRFPEKLLRSDEILINDALEGRRGNNTFTSS